MTAVDSIAYIYICWSLGSKISRSAAISLTEQLKSQLPQAQELGHTPAGAVYRSWRPVLTMRIRAYSPTNGAPSTKSAQ
jgi:hypothetical protein